MKRRPSIAPRARQAGVALIDGLAGIAVLGFGMLGLGTLQARLVDSSSQAQMRLQAVRHADALISMALVDPAQGVCYEAPVRQAGACADGGTLAAVQSWRETTLAALPAPADAQAVLEGSRLTVTLRWTSKDAQQHELTMLTDVRP